MRKRLARSLVVAALGTMLAAGCGGGSSGSAETDVSASPGSEPSAEFAGDGENGELATIGTEVSRPEREVASRFLEESLRGRELRDWAEQCGTLTEDLLKKIEKGGSDCFRALEARFASTPRSARANTLHGQIDAMRIVDGPHAFAFYHGTDGKDYAMPMEKVGDRWKVDALEPLEVP